VKKPRLRSSQMQWWWRAWPGVSINCSGRPARSMVMPSCAARTRSAATGPPCRRNAISSAPYTRCALISSASGSIMWRAPRGCTTSGAFGSSCISRPAPPAWSRCTWVDDDPVDRDTARGRRCQRGEQARHRMVGAGVDEGGAAVFDHQVGRIEHRAVKAGVDDVDAVKGLGHEVAARGEADDFRSLSGFGLGSRRGESRRQTRRRRGRVAGPHNEPATTDGAANRPGPKGWACKGAQASLQMLAGY
jgi:hypothetical protein